MVNRGYVVLEGADGAGTTTQRDMLVGALADRGRAVLVAKQPSARPVGAFIRQVLAGEVEPIDPVAFQVLFTADRIDDGVNVLAPWLKTGGIVIGDRCELSTAVYLSAQTPPVMCVLCGDGEAPGAHACSRCDEIRSGLAREAMDMAVAWNRPAVHPGLVVLVDVPFEVARARRRARGGKSEVLDADIIQRRVVALYRERGESLCARWGIKFEVVDGEGTPEEVHQRILDLVKQHLDERGS